MGTVLLVDDMEDTAEAVKMFFEMQGFTCWTAKNSDEALKLLTEQTPSLVLLDIRLDGSRLDGFGILQEASKLPTRSKMKIYMITGYHEPEKQARARELGADDYLTKPLPLEKLKEILKSIG